MYLLRKTNSFFDQGSEDGKNKGGWVVGWGFGDVGMEKEEGARTHKRVMCMRAIFFRSFRSKRKAR